ncbi:MAG: hypothetical protein A2X64_05645 [Ignavibacteria bacterium GWF2_33_9]|nr:MAG: hypothetical protein A2X64_05645 [Ignavibacteria bacterium GWF2_33_9]
MQSKNNITKAVTKAANLNQAKNIEISLPAKYSLLHDADAHLDKFEENAFFSYLVNEFFRQIRKKQILSEEIISELSFLCESYFDYIELDKQIDFDYENNFEEEMNTIY